ncbi:MAG TPA: uracil-DNA glycosylase [Candidatus Kapabacteria bacterium]|jgi:uracil-DNA glycosylase family 4|nr:uracil-DNA glycosylase [Ignavibacteria bacterium]HRE57711.1 uracil-DNA glycosylase [Candidatus Kapabacteria bacterium]
MNNETSVQKAIRYIKQHQQVFGDVIYKGLESFPVQQSTSQNTIAQQEPEITLTINSEWQQSSSLEVLQKRICECMQCPLGKTRTKFVFGVGNPNADIMVIGEAPGADEDAKGEPFVGRAGQLLTKILQAINFEREEVFIANILKCRPPDNRTPIPSEVEQCEPYLLKQIELIKPKFILAVGLTAANTLLKQKFKMADIRGKVFDYHGVNMLVTYHPAALLRNPEWKKYTWEDVQLLRRLYDESQKQ